MPICDFCEGSGYDPHPEEPEYHRMNILDGACRICDGHGEEPPDLEEDEFNNWRPRGGVDTCRTPEEVYESIRRGAIPVLCGDFEVTIKSDKIRVSEGSPTIIIGAKDSPIIDVMNSSSPIIRTQEDSTPFITARDQSQPLIQTWGDSQPTVISHQEALVRVEVRGRHHPEVDNYGKNAPIFLEVTPPKPALEALLDDLCLP